MKALRGARVLASVELMAFSKGKQTPWGARRRRVDYRAPSSARVAAPRGVPPTLKQVPTYRRPGTLWHKRPLTQSPSYRLPESLFKPIACNRCRRNDRVNSKMNCRCVKVAFTAPPIAAALLLLLVGHTTTTIPCSRGPAIWSGVLPCSLVLDHGDSRQLQVSTEYP
jgi:hypothetical protein